MNFEGILIGIGTFLVIGILHPIVIKTEYYIGVKAWPCYLVIGMLCIGVSLYVQEIIPSALLSILGFSLLWSIHELFEQVERVKKGWFPSNPSRKQK